MYFDFTKAVLCRFASSSGAQFGKVVFLADYRTVTKFHSFIMDTVGSTKLC